MRSVRTNDSRRSKMRVLAATLPLLLLLVLKSRLNIILFLLLIRRQRARYVLCRAACIYQAITMPLPEPRTRRLWMRVHRVHLRPFHRFLIWSIDRFIPASFICSNTCLKSSLLRDLRPSSLATMFSSFKILSNNVVSPADQFCLAPTILPITSVRHTSSRDVYITSLHMRRTF